MNSLRSKVLKCPGGQHMGLHLHCWTSPVGPEIWLEVMSGARHLEEGSRLPVIKARDKVLEQDFQTAGPADSFVGHRSKLVGHKHHLKKKCLLEDNCYTILCWFLPYINMNQSEVYITSPPSQTSLPIPTPPHPSRLAQSPGLSSRCIQQTPTGWLFYIREYTRFHGTLSVRPALSFPRCICKSAFYVCISIAAQYIGPSVPL